MLLNELLGFCVSQISTLYLNVKKNMLDFFLKKSQIIGLTPIEKGAQSNVN